MDESARKIKQYQWEDIGVEHSQYFQGRGTAYSNWEEVYIGIGEDAKEAISDAIDSAAMSGWDVDKLPKRPRGFSKETVQDVIDANREPSDEEEEEEDEEEEEEEEEDEEPTELYYHVALYVR